MSNAHRNKFRFSFFSPKTNNANLILDLLVSRCHKDSSPCFSPIPIELFVEPQRDHNLHIVVRKAADDEIHKQKNMSPPLCTQTISSVQCALREFSNRRLLPPQKHNGDIPSPLMAVVLRTPSHGRCAALKSRLQELADCRMWLQAEPQVVLCGTMPHVMTA